MIGRRLWTVALLLVAVRALAATPIGDVVKNRDAFANQIVTVEGTVTGKALGYKSEGIYDLRGADEYTITIVGRGTVPAAGTKLSVTGKVGRKPADEEFDFPPVILESTRIVQ